MASDELQDKLDGDVPDDVAHWIVEFHCDFDDRDLTPLQAAHKAYTEVAHGHHCKVTHVRSGLQFSVDLLRDEVIECVTMNLRRLTPP
jgi:hypothetical protein